MFPSTHDKIRMLKSVYMPSIVNLWCIYLLIKASVLINHSIFFSYYCRCEVFLATIVTNPRSRRVQRKSGCDTSRLVHRYGLQKPKMLIKLGYWIVSAGGYFGFELPLWTGSGISLRLVCEHFLDVSFLTENSVVGSFRRAVIIAITLMYLPFPPTWHPISYSAHSHSMLGPPRECACVAGARGLAVALPFTQPLLRFPHFT